MRHPDVTVILPTYNRSWGLRRAAESVLAQTHADFELLIIDDHSTDDTEAVARSLGDPRARYARQERNVGVGRNWGDGVRMCRTPYFCLLMDDDGYRPDFLRERVQAVRRRPDLDMVFSGYEVRSLAGEPVGEGRLWFAGETELSGEPLLRALLEQPRWIGTFLLRTEAVRRHWPAAERYDIVVDFALLLRMAARGSRAVALPGLEFWMTAHAGQTSHTRRDRMYRLAVCAMKDLLREGLPRPEARVVRRHLGETLMSWARESAGGRPAAAAGRLLESWWNRPGGHLRHRFYILLTILGLRP